MCSQTEKDFKIFNWIKKSPGKGKWMLTVNHFFNSIVSLQIKIEMMENKYLNRARVSERLNWVFLLHKKKSDRSWWFQNPNLLTFDDESTKYIYQMMGGLDIGAICALRPTNVFPKLVNIYWAKPGNLVTKFRRISENF